MTKPLLPWCLVIIVGWSGCGPSPPWRWQYYLVHEYPARAPVLNKSVAVLPFEDNRLKENSSYCWLALIPLVPYARLDFNRPEEVTDHIATARWTFRPSDDLARAIAHEINNAHLFNKTFFTDDESKGELVLTGTISSTKYEAKCLSYGLSVYVGVVVLFGAPFAEIMNDIGLTLSLTDRISGTVLWQAAYTNTVRYNHYLLMPNDARYEKVLQELMPSILSDIETALKEPAR